MTWNYTNDPENEDRDKVRFLVGDVDKNDPLVSDEEIAFALSKFPIVELASAYVLRALAARFSRKASLTVGSVSSSCSDIAKAFSDRAKELDPDEETTGAGVSLCLPVFGGLSISEKETLDSDTDAVPPIFRKGMDDIPGGPDDLTTPEDDRIR